MDTLFQALFLYAMENQIPRFSQENRWKIHRCARAADAAAAQLAAMGKEPERCARQLEQNLNEITFLEQEAAFLAGLSIGLELGRL